MIPISHRNGEVSEKAGSGCPGDEFLGLVKGWLGAGGTLWEKNRARRARLGQTDVYLQPPEGYKTNSGFHSITIQPSASDGLFCHKTSTERTSKQRSWNPTGQIRSVRARGGVWQFLARRIDCGTLRPAGNRKDLKSGLSQEIKEAELGNAAADFKNGVTGRLDRGELGNGSGKVISHQIILPLSKLDFLAVQEDL